MVQITASRLQLLIANPVGGAIFISGPKIGLKSTKIVVFCILFRLMEGARIPPPLGYATAIDSQLVVRESLSGGTRVDYFLKVNFLFSVCNILFQLVQHSFTLSLLQVIISAFRVYCRARYLINCPRPDIWYCGG